MCDGCNERKDVTRPPAAASRLTAEGGGAILSRRSVLVAGASVAAGVVLGLWSCQNGSMPERAGAGAATGPKIDSQPSTASSQVAVAGPTSGPESQTTETAPSTTRLATPDLGSEVFPDAKGIAIARPGDAPVIVVPRTDWTASRPNLSQIEVMDGVQRITVHHTAGAIQTDAWRPTAGELESIREFHAGTRPGDRQWADIAYHFAVDRAGRVWQARPLAYQGAHVKGNNEHNLGIVLLGNFEVQSPSAAQLTALGAFIGFVRRLYAVPLNQVFTHGELGMTSCPGKTLQAYMDRTRGGWARAEGVAWQAVTRPAGTRVGAI